VPKVATIYFGPFEILENIGSVAYMIALHASMRVHNLFQVSLLKKYVPNPKHIINWNVIQVEHEGDLRVEPICILDQKVKILKNKAIGMVNIQWMCYSDEDATWEHEENMQEEYPQSFENFEENRMQDSILSI
jgi:hypothetical protein